LAHADPQLLDERLLAFIDQGPLTVYTNRPDETSSNVYMSPQLEAILGYSAEDDPDFFRKVLHPDDRDWVLAEQLERLHEPVEDGDFIAEATRVLRQEVSR
jgi:PAS domain-containing protein